MKQSIVTFATQKPKVVLWLVFLMTLLLGANIPIVEHMCNLDQLPSSNFKFHAVPPKVSGMGSFPVRAFAIV